MSKKAKPIEEKFLEKHIKTDTCWLWTGQNNGKYGQIVPRKYKTILAHRWSYEYHKGSIPEGMHVCHKCDVPLCVNPEHLFLGTPKENMEDMILKNRSYRQNQTHCQNGHEFSGENFRMSTTRNERICKICRNEYMKKWRSMEK